MRWLEFGKVPIGRLNRKLTLLSFGRGSLGWQRAQMEELPEDAGSLGKSNFENTVLMLVVSIHSIYGAVEGQLTS